MSGGMRGWRRMLFLTCGCACSSTSRTCRRRILPAPGAARYADGKLDRKSTRLNSSHSQSPYAVLCLKKRNYPTPPDQHGSQVGTAHAPTAPRHLNYPTSFILLSDASTRAMLFIDELPPKDGLLSACP